MSTEKSDQEPSMEEILSSIRRIIADDEEDGTPAKKTPADDEPSPKIEPNDPEPADEDVEPEPADEDVLDLTEVVARGTEPLSETPSVEEVVDEIELEPEVELATPAQQPTPKPEHAASERPMSGDEALVSDAAASASTGAFAKLAKAALGSDSIPIASGGKTVEAFLIELLRPMLKEWLDANLEAVVERVVEQEVKKLARRAELM